MVPFNTNNEEDHTHLVIVSYYITTIYGRKFYYDQVNYDYDNHIRSPHSCKSYYDYSMVDKVYRCEFNRLETFVHCV